MSANRTELVPLVILGGSDRRPAKLPENSLERKPLRGYKAFEIRIDGRPMIEHLCRRCLSSGMFSALYVAGPASVYDKIELPAEIIDTDGNFGQNIRAGIEHAAERHPDSSIGFITCDILPDVDSIRRLMTGYYGTVPCDLWFPMVRTPEGRSQLGASEWKPAYRIANRKGEKASGILPGHLAVVDPKALRLRFLYRLLQIGYRTRNRPIRHRRAVMLKKLILELFYQDVLHIVSLRIPNLTWTMLKAALPVAEELKEGTLTRERLENAIRKMFVRYRHRKKHPDRRVHFPQVDELSLALDVDTEEEARAIGGEIEKNSA
jgi:hypothetical protein